MPNDLIDFWRRVDLSRAPYAHPDDLEALASKGGKYADMESKDFGSFVAGSRFGDFKDNRFHLSLLPAPYGGDLAKADIFILLLNPGFGFADYHAEYKSAVFRARAEGNLKQDFDGVEFPFLWLDPEFCWHGGFAWWEKKLRKTITRIAEARFNGRYLDALKNLSRRLAQIELVPYHSPSFGAHGLIKKLESSKKAKAFVRSSLIPAALAGGKTVIVTRRDADWGTLHPSEHVIVYKGGLTRGASLGPETPGGKAILRRYGINT